MWHRSKNTKSAGTEIIVKCQSLLNGTGSKANLSNYLTSHLVEMRESVQPLGRVLGFPILGGALRNEGMQRQENRGGRKYLSYINLSASHPREG